MAHGFELYDASGSLMLSSESIAYILLDTFEVTQGSNGNKTYTGLPAGMVLTADYTIGDISWSTRAADAVASSLVDGYFALSIGGSALSWDWFQPNNEGWDFTKVIVRVFGA